MVTKTAIHLFELSSSNTPFGVAKMLLCCKPCWFLDLPVVMELSFKMTAISVEYGRTLSNATHGNRTLPVSQELVSGTLSGCCFESLKPAIFEEKFSPSHSFSEIQWWCPSLGSTTKRYKIYFSKELSFKGNILLCLTLEVQHFFKKNNNLPSAFWHYWFSPTHFYLFSIFMSFIILECYWFYCLHLLDWIYNCNADLVQAETKVCVGGYNKCDLLKSSITFFPHVSVCAVSNPEAWMVCFGV